MSNFLKKGTAYYQGKGILKISIIVVLLLAVIAVGVAAVVLPQYTQETPTVDKTVSAIVVQNNGLISVDADLSKVYVTIKYTDGTESELSLSEVIITGLDTSSEQTLDNIVLDVGGYKQTVTYTVVSSAKVLKYVAGTGGTIKGETEQHINAGYDGTTVVAVPDEGYDFLRWSDGDTNAIRTDKQVSRDQTLTATFTKKQYTVVFYYPDGTTAREELVFHGEAATKVPTASEAEMQLYGYVLVGWSEDYSSITADTNIYPVFEKYAADMYLSFTKSSEGVALGVANAVNSYYAKGEEGTIRVQANAYRSFVGWEITQYDGTVYSLDKIGETTLPISTSLDYITFKAAQTASSSEYSLTFTPNGDTSEIYVKAVFKYDTSTITFSSMGTSLSSKELAADIAIGELFDVEEPQYADEATRADYLASAACPSYLKVDGYTFLGWYVSGSAVDPSTGLPEFVANQTKFNAPTALVAYWEKNVYEVVFMLGENSDVETFKSRTWFDAAAGEAVPYYSEEAGGLVLTILYQDPLSSALTGIFPEITPYKNDYYTFSGWYLAENASGVATTQLVDKTYKVTNNIWIVPVFKVNQQKLDTVIQGSGSVSIVNEDNTTSALPGSYILDADGTYVFRFVPGNGYTFNWVEVSNGLSSERILAENCYNAATNCYEYTVASPIVNDYDFVVSFVTTEYNITVTNGNAALKGTVKHDDASESSDITQNIPVYNGQSKRLWITAPEYCYIYAVSVDGALKTDIPASASEYTLVLDNISAAVAVVIEYRHVVLNVVVADGDNVSNGSVDISASEVVMGSDPGVAVTADSGYYISSLKINGVTFDPYHSGTGITVSDLISVCSLAESTAHDASGKLVDATNDIRVTYYVLTFDTITSGKTIEAVFSPIYYYVTTSSSGVGTLTSTASQTTIGGSVSITASTSANYYVESYSHTNPSADTEAPGYENVISVVQTSARQNVVFNIRNIQRDVEVMVSFQKCKYNVSFATKDTDGNNGEFASLSYISAEETELRYDLPATIAMDALSDNNFVIKADDGYIISGILVQTEDDIRNSTALNVVGRNEVVAFNAASHTLTLNDIEGAYVITVTCKAKTFNIESHLTNAKETYKLNGNEATKLVETVEYGEEYLLSVTYDEDRLFSRANVIVSGAEYSIYTDSNVQFTVHIPVVTADVEITVMFVPVQDGVAPFNIYLKSDETEGALTASREAVVEGQTTYVEVSQASAGDTVVISVAPTSTAFVLKTLIVNGKAVAVTDNTYRIENVNEDLYVEALFDDNVLDVCLAMQNNFGMLSSDVDSFVYGDTVTLKVVSNTGYNVESLNIGSRANPKPLNNTIIAKFNATDGTAITEYAIDTSDYTYAELQNGLYVSIVFEPIVYDLYVTTNGSGSVSCDTGINLDVDYGTNHAIVLSANANNYISSIVVNGTEYDPLEIANITVNAEIQKVTNGTLSLDVTGDLTVSVTFSPNVYGVTITEASNGTTTVRTAATSFSDGSDLELLAGTDLIIKMEASTGNHISELIINGTTVNEEEWKMDLDSPNNNRSITYAYPSIAGNVHIQVVYAINTYSVAIQVKNLSLNFRNTDSTAASFGVVAIRGLTADSTSSGVDTSDSNLMITDTYSGIEHGSSVYFTFAPVTYNGYVIDLDTAIITYYDTADKTTSEAKIIYLKSLISETGGAYVLPSITCDIESVYVEFVKQTYTYNLSHVYEQMGSNYLPSNSGISIAFTNPYATGDEVIVENVGGTLYYEYGLDFVVTCVAGNGYSVSSFTLNGDDRMSSMRGMTYSGRITSDIDIIATYKIDVYRVAYTTNLTASDVNKGLGSYAIYTCDGDLIWAPSMSLNNITTPIYTSNGTIVSITATHVTVTYNTQLIFRATPAYSLYGYKVDQITVNSSYQTLTDEDAQNDVLYTVTSASSAMVKFSIHYYDIAVNTFGGGSYSIDGDSSVMWNDSVTVILKIDAGYRMTGILVNGTADAALLANAQKTTLTDASTQYEIYLENVKADKTLTVVTERIAYNITFANGFAEAFNVNGVSQNSVTGAVINQGMPAEAAYFSTPSKWQNANSLTSSNDLSDTNKYVYNTVRFADTLSIYFMPIDGYEIKNVTITMRNVLGSTNTLVNTVNGLTVYNARYGYYVYSIPAVSGNVVISVNYQIKTYNVSIAAGDNGAVTLVNLNDEIQSGNLVNIPSKITHYDKITIEFTADYGYHLESLTINGKVWSEVEYAINNGVYWYTTDTQAIGDAGRLTIDAETINGQTSFVVQAVFAVNTYAVNVNINGNNTLTDTALSVILSGNKMQFGQEYTLFQSITEGYSITDMTVKDNDGNVIASYLKSNPTDASVLQNAAYSFIPTGAYIDHLDYHDTVGTNAVLYFYYNTEINTHVSYIETYLYEYDASGNLISDPTAIPTVVNAKGKTVNAYSLTQTYNNVEKGNGIYDYNVEAKFKFSMNTAATEDYVFVGYQLYDEATSAWKYVVDDDVFDLSSSVVSVSGAETLDTLEYTIRSDMRFRAIVYKMYEVTVEVHPEYKWQSGILSLTNFNMRYVTYSALTATLVFPEALNPNSEASSVALDDTDNLADASYTYKVYCGAYLQLKLSDNRATVNPITSTSYYDVTYNVDGTMVTTPKAYGTASTINVTSDRLIHAYANNDKMHLDVAVETEGESTGSMGGDVKYYVQSGTGSFVAKTLSNSALLLATNSVVRLEITPNTSYRFDGVFQMDSQENAVNNYQVFNSTTWNELNTTADGMIDVTTQVSGGKTSYIVTMRVIENTIIKIKFWKQMEVTGAVHLLYGDTEREITSAEATGIFQYLKFDRASADGVYDYADDVAYSVPEIIESNTWNCYYQFVGFFVNGINSYQQLDTGYPDSNSVSYRLYDYEETTQPDGVTMTRANTSSMYQVNIVAKYVMVMNVTFVNEYTYATDYGTVYFDTGFYTYGYTPYDNVAPQYYTASESLYALAAAGDHTDTSVQIMAKLNSVSDTSGRLSASSSYNKWLDNYISLSWSRDTDENPNSEGYTFTSWQYYAYNAAAGTWSWQILPDANVNDSNKPTNVNYEFAISSLYSTSYFASAMSAAQKMSVSMYDEDFEYEGNMDIFTIKIKPVFQRKENINIENVVYTEAEGIANASMANMGTAYIEGLGDAKGTFNYYTTVTLKTGYRQGYSFLGWVYYDEETGTYTKVSDMPNITSPMTKDRNLQLDGTDLKVRLVKSTNVQALYIKTWSITVEVVNSSASNSSSLLTNSAPVLMYYGVAQTDANGNETYNSVGSSQNRTFTMALNAGVKLKFMLSFANTQYDATYDRYVGTNVYYSGVLQDWTNTSEATTCLNRPSAQTSATSTLSRYEIIVTANEAKTVSIEFETMGKLVINKIYPGSSMVLPTSFYNVMSAKYPSTWTQNLVKDGGVLDSDGSENGSVTISGIPISKADTLTLDGVFANKLPSMGGSCAYVPVGVSSYGINFSGASLDSYGKYQSFIYYNTSAGSNDGMSKQDMPFYVNGSTYGTGTSANPYLLSTVAHMRSMETFLNNNQYTLRNIYFRLVNDINVSALAPSGLFRASAFDGVFNGSGYALTGFASTNLGTYTNVGIFSATRGATLTDIKLGSTTQTTLSSNSSAQYVGYLVGNATNTAISNISSNTGAISITAYAYIGAIVGYADGTTTLTNCNMANAIILRATSSTGIAGGLVGCLAGTSGIRSSSLTGSINLTGTKRIGGIVGLTTGSSVYAVDNVSLIVPAFSSSTGAAIGGAVGENGAGKTINNVSFTTGNFTITTASTGSGFTTSALSSVTSYGGGCYIGYNLGTLSSCTLSNKQLYLNGSVCGGLVGINGSTGNIVSCQLSYCYITTSHSTANSGGGVYGGFAGYNMGTIRSCSIYASNNQGMNATNCFYLVKSMTYESNAFQTSGINQATGGDSAHIYVGGAVGYNTGNVQSNYFSGVKVLVNRWMGNNTKNYTYCAAVVAYNANSVSYNTTSSSSSFVYMSIWADGTTGTILQYVAQGLQCAYGSVSGASNSNGYAARTIVGNGNYYSNWATNGTSKGYSSSGYRSAHVSRHNGDISVSESVQTTRNLATSGGLNTDSDTDYWWAGWSGLKRQTIYTYSGKLRKVNLYSW